MSQVVTIYLPPTGKHKAAAGLCWDGVTRVHKETAIFIPKEKR